MAAFRPRRQTRLDADRTGRARAGGRHGVVRRLAGPPVVAAVRAPGRDDAPSGRRAAAPRSASRSAATSTRRTRLSACSRTGSGQPGRSCAGPISRWSTRRPSSPTTGPASSGQPKAYNFVAPTRLLDVLRHAGVDVVTVANNHGLDYGQLGLARTLAARSTAAAAHDRRRHHVSAAFAPARRDRPRARGGVLRRDRRDRRRSRLGRHRESTRARVDQDGRRTGPAAGRGPRRSPGPSVRCHRRLPARRRRTHRVPDRAATAAWPPTWPTTARTQC